MSTANQISFDANADLGIAGESSSRGKGHQPMLIGHAVNGGERAANRGQLRRAFGNMYNPGLESSPALYKTNVLGPFRSAFNAGDVITNKIVATDSKYGKLSNQVGGNNLTRLQTPSDGNSSQNGTAMFSGNPRHVYDGSDYARFKKLNAINKNYNDITHSGSSARATQHVFRRVRR
jgi:hypothetical protein